MTNLELAERGAYDLWREKWQTCADLKKRYQPNGAPLELWTPAAEACEKAFRQWQGIKADLLRAEVNRGQV